MPADLAFPWYTSPIAVILIFVAFTLIFHVFFIWIGPRKPVFWKAVDYFWLSMAFIGILGSIGTGRGIVAKTMLDVETMRLESARTYVHDRAKDGTSESVCRQFIPSPIMAPENLERIQNEFDAQCRWFRDTYFTISKLPRNDEPMDVTKLAPPYPLGGDQGHFNALTRAIASFNEELLLMDALRKEGGEGWFEKLLRLLGPAIIAVALGLRMTKVTAEVIGEINKK